MVPGLWRLTGVLVLPRVRVSQGLYPTSGR
jgi:hypothetical protein